MLDSSIPWLSVSLKLDFRSQPAVVELSVMLSTHDNGGRLPSNSSTHTVTVLSKNLSIFRVALNIRSLGR